MRWAEGGGALEAEDKYDRMGSDRRHVVKQGEVLLPPTCMVTS